MILKKMSAASVAYHTRDVARHVRFQEMIVP